jgi:hypothetical protein
VAYVFSLTQEQESEYERAGALTIPGYFPAADMARMADAVWSDIRKRFGIDRDRPETWTVERPGKFQKLIRSGAFRALGSERLFAIGDALLGPGTWEMPKRFGFPLVTFAGHMPDRSRPLWHTDIPPSACVGALCTLRLFTFLEPVHPRGGGTLFVAGAHRLVLEIARRNPGETVRSADIRTTLKQEHPWFADLFSSGGDDVARSMHGTVLNGVEVCVREMTGEPGDLVLMHPAMLHAGANNLLPRPRMMLTEWIWRRGSVFGES